MEEMYNTRKDAQKPSSRRRDSLQISDSSEIEKIVDKVIEENPEDRCTISCRQDRQLRFFCWPGDEGYTGAGESSDGE